ncbi:hemopexin repeat-containing protein [Streptomyces roseifaciens]|uniref:hemopexin repeat-containing protein n=1 Tax=Streptomyces roseifaciens TaxID=1488406 RepID=UPI000717FAE4|nr:hemopexin repeat-containing protein [Streptomyces roseifaciens]
MAKKVHTITRPLRQTSGDWHYVKWHWISEDVADKEIDRSFEGAFQGTPEQRRWFAAAVASDRSMPSLYVAKTGKVYFLCGDTYVRCTQETMTIDEGFPKSISSYWPGLKAVGFDRDIDAILSWDEKTVYLFKGLQYVRYNLETNKVDDGYPKSIALYWPGFKEAGFDSGIDAFVRWDTDRAYAFKGDQYIRFHIPTNKVDQAPRKTINYWNPLATLGPSRLMAMYLAGEVE